ncbi:MAG: HTH domain-containing protein [Thermoguttaceae bacterium]|jgi:predicted DNA-binding transcriptional regulator YafY
MPRPAHPLTTRVRRRPPRKNTPAVHSTIPRQWKLLEILSSDPRGFTVKELAAKSAVSEKTIRRDLILLRQSGFDVSEIVEQFGRKRWRIRHPFDAVSDRPQRYRLIRDSIRVLRGQAEALGDALLAAALEAIEGKIRKKCEDKKPRPR